MKKAQFVAPQDVRLATEILLTEHGASFGCNNLVVDMRSLAILREFGFPVIFGATHSVQLPGAAAGVSGGQARFIEPLARAAVAVGIDGLFVEVHEAPERALSDGPNALRLESLGGLLEKLRRLDALVKAAGFAH
jgi:2-dehydro-3-deoxyphosphooctonate aldolase (KDO 8-P synthase)